MIKNIMPFIVLLIMYASSVLASCKNYTVHSNFIGQVFDVGNAKKNNISYAKGNYVIIWDTEACIKKGNDATDYCGGHYLYDNLTKISTKETHDIINKGYTLGCSDYKIQAIDISNNQEFLKKYFD